MSKSRLTGGPVIRPMWPPNLSTVAVPALQNGAAVINSADDRFIITSYVVWADGASHDLHTIHFRTGSSSSPVMTGRTGPRDVDTANGPPARDDGTPDQVATQGNPASNTNYSLTLDADRTLAHGALISIVFDNSAYTSGSWQVTTLGGVNTSSMHRPVLTFYDGATYALVATNGIAMLTLEAADGTFGYLYGTLPRISAAINSHAINTGTSPDEIGIAFTVSEPQWGMSAQFLLTAAADADFDIVLYSGTDVVSTVSCDYNTLAVSAAVRWVQVVFADAAFVSGTTYRVVVKPTTANSVTVYSFDVSAAGHLTAWAGTLKYCERENAGAFTDTATRMTFGQIGLSAFDSGGGGGGPLVGASRLVQ